jgi:hypothetical protein
MQSWNDVFNKIYKGQAQKRDPRKLTDLSVSMGTSFLEFKYSIATSVFSCSDKNLIFGIQNPELFRLASTNSSKVKPRIREAQYVA